MFGFAKMSTDFSLMIVLRFLPRIREPGARLPGRDIEASVPEDAPEERHNFMFLVAKPHATSSQIRAAC